MPTIFFLIAAFGEDETATASVDVSDLLLLSAISLLSGAAAGALAWALARGARGGTRAVGLTLLLIAAGAWGLVTGFLGAFSISWSRHPTWDDA